jgi:D-alanine transaminase
MIVYFNKRFIPKEDVNISPDDRGFLFADGAYEVIRSYNGKLFRAEDHVERMKRSLRELRINGAETEDFQGIAQKLIQDNGLENTDASVYIQVTRGAAPRKHTFPETPVPPTVYVAASPFDPPEDKWKNGVKVILVPDIRWTRCDIKSVALVPNVLACQQAKEQGAGEAVFVRDGVITEATHSNFCAVFDGELCTFPESNYILSGVTRKVVLELCKSLNIPVKEFPIFEKDLENADECMILGTITEVMPVVQIGDRKVGDGKPGPVTIKLQNALRELR